MAQRYIEGSTLVAVRLPSDVHEEIVRFAEKFKQTKSQIIVEAVSAYILKLRKEEVLNNTEVK